MKNNIFVIMTSFHRTYPIILICLLSFHAQAQTSYDSFVPESTRPMLGQDTLHAMKQELGLSAQNNCDDFLVQGTRTYWSLTKSVCHPQWNMIESGIYFGSGDLFDWYKITDENDTLSLGEGSDWNINVDHRSFKLHEDTLFVMQWDIDGCCTHGHSYDTISYTINAYKIIYITKQRLLLLELKKDSLSRWVENTYPPCYELNILEYKCKKDEPNSP